MPTGGGVIWEEKQLAQLTMGNFFSLLTTLGIPHGQITGEGFKPRLVVFLEQGRRIISSGVQNHIHTPEEAERLEQALSATGLLPDFEAIFQKVREFVLPENFHPTLVFKVCKECSNPMAHGFVLLPDANQSIRHAIPTMLEGLNLCLILASRSEFSDLAIISLLKEMLAANLATDDDQLMERFMALPEEVKQLFAQEVDPLEEILNLADQGGVSTANA
ncbi:MAG: hypothetical protein UT86_C0001G0118 [Candidatus Magasanikbacteria bacterium GW2011_GWC2_40_17]|uniref:Uncharacterized protein n=1 Tax=Candidatus Magasanikbacteria bacterium GW2011_GWA2_42_32 TaxID=1619039 RepID=A0A0G1D5Y6_9BACT|nr:MAG: hypothetical protein UT86_C0001G0118 [Candidatus Magasanikbacteria bacterium GW2011_GWC2_40_17]KKS57478.1 MAG: hypothetical protein UV20_C0001G0118 [Candidatus Magasanikbacteria bacterium GW2011_GWA2_42_32]OGH85194.1 MAG: hypothetical protein A2294_00395 [Candidatus Magasanikbacteria bacterium RIFOXYB2_FULL_38_10]